MELRLAYLSSEQSGALGHRLGHANLFALLRCSVEAINKLPTIQEWLDQVWMRELVKHAGRWAKTLKKIVARPSAAPRPTVEGTISTSRSRCRSIPFTLEKLDLLGTTQRHQAQ